MEFWSNSMFFAELLRGYSTNQRFVCPRGVGGNYPQLPLITQIPFRFFLSLPFFPVLTRLPQISLTSDRARAAPSRPPLGRCLSRRRPLRRPFLPPQIFPLLHLLCALADPPLQCGGACLPHQPGTACSPPRPSGVHSVPRHDATCSLTHRAIDISLSWSWLSLAPLDL